MGVEIYSLEFKIMNKKRIISKLELKGEALTLKEVTEKFELAGFSADITKDAIEVARKPLKNI